MTTSNNGEEMAPMPFVTVDAETFRVIFQASKELANLPQDFIVAVGRTREEAMMILGIARAVRKLLTDNSIVSIRLLAAGSNDDSAVFSPAIERSGEGADDATKINLLLPADLVAAWHDLIETVGSWLGERELFLRTGFDQIALADAAARLDARRSK